MMPACAAFAAKGLSLMTSVTMILETPRLALRRLLPEDLDALFALYRDPDVRRYFPDGARTLEETRLELE